MKKLLLLFMFVLAACGAPEVIRETAVPVEPKVIRETALPPIVVTEATLLEPEFVEYGIKYFQTTRSTRFWELLGKTEDGDLVFKKVEPELRIDAGNLVIVYNGRGEGPEAEFYLVDGHLALAGASFPNAQDLVCVDEGEAEHVYPDFDGICEDGQERTALFAGRWAGKWVRESSNEIDNLIGTDDRYFYKVAGVGGETAAKLAGLYIMADHGFFPSCETAVDEDGNEFFVNFSYLSEPDSCAQ